MSGAATMARPKGRPTKQPAKPEPAPASRTTIINLKGSQEQAAWLEEVNRKTHIPKAAIVRLALSEWAERHGHPTFPGSEGEG
jgi:hypothetical protein